MTRCPAVRRSREIALLSWALLAAAPALPQNGPHIRDWQAPASEQRLRPLAGCASLRALTGYEFTVAIATESGSPAFCRILGQVQPDIRFEVALPAAWNGRLYMFGNGGFAGESLDAPGRQARRDQALKLGFAVASTNTGHDAVEEPLGTFALNSQKLLDYAFRSLHVTATTAKSIALAYYGKGPRRSYFDGCSTGGRQGLILAQRFPRDFDGIVVGMPVLNFTGTMVRYAATQAALARAPLTLDKVRLLSRHVYEHCDGKDGLRDGLIDDPRRCGFTPSKHLPACTGPETGDCFTSAQIAAIETIYADVMSQGKRVFPGWPVGSEIPGPNGRPGWADWTVREQGQSISAMFAESFFRYLAFPRKDPSYRLDQFDLEKDPARLTWISSVLDATDADLTAFRSHGGKILMYYGWADQALNPLMGVEYYESVIAKMGALTGDFFKLYMMPGVFHCGGGVGPGAFDPLNPLIGWVEQNKPPGRIVATQMDGDKAVRSRPLCPYPQVARHSGNGSPDEAASFRCADPPK